MAVARQGDGPRVQRQTVEAGTMLRGETLQTAQSPFLVKHLGVGLQREGGVEDAGAATGRLLGGDGVRR